MLSNPFELLKARRFLPLFITQFLGAFNDNIYKNGLVILITYSMASELKFNIEILITIAAGIFILPFFLFSATAGQLADKFEKSRLVRYIKTAEVFLALFACIGFYLHSIFLLMFVLFLLGTQATFFGPIKYSILPDHLKKDELIAGNAYLEAGTYLAILLGTIIGGVLAIFSVGPLLVSIAVVLVAVAGLISSLSIPSTKIAAPNLKINLNFLQESWNIVRYSFRKNEILLCIIGISWFWLIGATYISQFPTYAKVDLHAQPSIVTLFLTIFTAGIGVGSLLCNRLLKGKIHATYVPLAALGITIFGIDLVIASHSHRPATQELIGLFQFLSSGAHWRILFDLFILSICGGIYIVPLYAILQYQSEEAYRSRMIASNNIINALFMVIAAIITSCMLYLNFSVSNVFLVIAIANLVVALYICNLLPEALVKSFLIWLFKVLYRAEIKGIENYHQAGERVLIIANHTSYLDAALLAALIPDRLTFAIDTQIACKWWVKILLKLVNTYSIDPLHPLGIKSLIEYLRKNHRLVIFPEGRITLTGALMKIYEGPGLVADKANAYLLPIRIEGAQYTPFSYLKGKVKIRWFPKITFTILKPRRFELPDTMTGRERRRLISAQLYDIMTDTMFLSSNRHETLFQSLLYAKSIHGKKHVVLEDIDRKPMDYKRLILSSIILGRYIAKTTQQEEPLGVMLPNSIAGVVVFFAMQAFHRIPAMLNFGTGVQNIILACQTANIKRVYTSRKFITAGKLQNVANSLVMNGIELIYLEDIRANISLANKMIGKIISFFPQRYYNAINNIHSSSEMELSSTPAVILFTSGSEGTPKGVVLSHENLQANRFQLTARVDFGPKDRIFNALPMFHAFGLNSGTLLPIVSGIRVFMYPSPLHYRIIPEICYDISATILFGTDTFLSNYGKYAHPYNFYSIRYVFGGAEKIREETHLRWMHKFGIRIFEGYGVTEASPVLATNTPMQYKAGTVGRLLPHISYQLKPVPGIEEGAQLAVSGPNIMLGYLFSHSPGKIIPPKDGWHDTGDIVTLDKDGYITIKGRAKRFAKIAGEMVSLTAVEEKIYLLWPEHQHAILSKPDPHKGEQIILVTSNKSAQQSHLLKHFRQQGIAEIGLPRKIIFFAKLPILGSGKVDYQLLITLLETPKEEEK